MQEGVFHQMPQLVKMLVMLALFNAVFLRRDHNLHSAGGCKLDNFVGVIALVSKQKFSVIAVYKFFCKLAIRSGTRCDKDSERHTKRIHGQVNFGVEPPFVRSIS